MDSGDESEDEPMSMEMLEDIHDGSHSQPIINRREALHKIHGHIKLRQSEWKGDLKYMRSMGLGLHKVFKIVVNGIPQASPILSESGSRVSYFIPELRKVSGVTRLSYDIKKPWIKETKKEIKNISNN